MALTQVGNKVYAKITDLSEESYLTDGDKLIFHCEATGSASIIDWTNFKVDLDHVTFGATFQEMLAFTQEAAAYFANASTENQQLSTQVTNAVNAVNKIVDDVNAIKVLLKLMLGAVDGEGTTAATNYIINELSSPNAREICYDIIKKGTDVINGGFTFNARNFKSFSTGSNS